jgi:hypothetical protein
MADYGHSFFSPPYNTVFVLLEKCVTTFAICTPFPPKPLHMRTHLNTHIYACTKQRIHYTHMHTNSNKHLHACTQAVSGRIIRWAKAARWCWTAPSPTAPSCASPGSSALMYVAVICFDSFNFYPRLDATHNTFNCYKMRLPSRYVLSPVDPNAHSPSAEGHAHSAGWWIAVVSIRRRFRGRVPVQRARRMDQHRRERGWCLI